MGLKYKLPISSATLSTTLSSLTIISGAVRALKITEIYIAGTGTASASNVVGLYRVATAGVTGSAAITAAPDSTGSPTQSFTNFAAYVTQPVVGSVLLAMPVNANGGVFYYRPMKGDEIEIPAGNVAAGTVTIRSISGTGTISGWITVEEI